MDKQKFEKLVHQGIQQIPKKFLDKLDNVSIIIKQKPNEKSIKSNYFLFGLYEGIPLTQRNLGYQNVLPDKITIFQKSIEQYAKTDTKIKELVRDTVWHEIAHHFGMDEKQVRKAEKRKGIKY